MFQQVLLDNASQKDTSHNECSGHGGIIGGHIRHGKRNETGYNNEDVRGLRYKDKVTIITGGSKGIGEGCVRVFGK